MSRTILLVLLAVLAALASLLARGLGSGPALEGVVADDSGSQSDVREGLVAPSRGAALPRRNVSGALSEATQANVGGEANDGAVFSVKDAQQATRSFVYPLHDDYQADFERNALSWPGDVGTDEFGVPLLSSNAVNPSGIRLTREERATVGDALKQYRQDLEALAVLAFEQASESQAHYFDTMVGTGWVRKDASGPRAPEPAAKGMWNRRMTVQHDGYERRIRFDSVHYPHLEDTLKSIQSLKGARLAALHAILEEVVGSR